MSLPTGSNSMGPDARRVAATLLRFQDVFEQAAACGVGPQVRRFVYLAAAAGLELEKVDLSDSLAIRHGGADQEILLMWWYSRSRCNFLVGPGFSELYGAEAVGVLPRAKVLRKMNVTETDQYLDSLEAVFGVLPLDDTPNLHNHRGILDGPSSVGPASSRSKLDGDIEEFPVPTSRSGFRNAIPQDPILSAEEIAAASGVLTPAFEDANMCGVELQVRRFAELTVAADLDVCWVEELRLLTANSRRTSQALFLLRWNPDGQVTGHFGIEENPTGRASARADAVEKAFGLRYTKDVSTLPELDYPATMSTAEVNRSTDSFLDWLETFLATHALPSKQAEVEAESEGGNVSDARMAVLYSVMSFLWIGLIWYSIVWASGELGSTLGDVRAEVVMLGVFYLVVPAGVLIHSLRVRRAIRRSGSDQGIELARGAMILGMLAIALAVMLTLAELIRDS